MTCGCGKSKAKAETNATTAAMCLSCPSRGVGGLCAASGRARIVHRAEVSCPRGRFPDGVGRVRWAWLLWWGVPWPLRLWLILSGHWRGKYTLPDPDDLPGCGCVVGLKAFIERLPG